MLFQLIIQELLYVILILFMISQKNLNLFLSHHICKPYGILTETSLEDIQTLFCIYTFDFKVSQEHLSLSVNIQPLGFILGVKRLTRAEIIHTANRYSLKA